MIKFIAYSALLLSQALCMGQAPVAGTIRIDTSAWANKIHLLRLPSLMDFFSGSSRHLFNSVTPDQHHGFSFTRKLPASFYKINIVPPRHPEGAIIAGGVNENYLVLFLDDNSYVRIHGSADSLKKSRITADPVNKELVALQQTRFRVNIKLTPIVQKLLALANAKNMDSIRGVVMRLAQQNLRENNTLIKSQLKATRSVPARIYGLYDIYNNGGSQYELAYIEKELSRLPANNIYVKEFKALIHESKYSLPVGSMAPDVRMADTSGKTGSLHQLDGQIVLVDFWASWCIPCIQEMRTTIKTLHEKYGRNGFTVVSISFDEDRSKWLKTIRQNRFNWMHYSDLKGTNSPIWKAYRLKALPTCYVLDKKKTILAKDLRGPQLESFIEKVFVEK